MKVDSRPVELQEPAAAPDDVRRGRRRHLLLPDVPVAGGHPGAGGLLISRAAFIANPKLYFAILHSGGPCLAV